MSSPAIFAGVINILLGFLIIVFPKFFSHIFWIRAQPVYQTSLNAKLGDDKSKKVMGWIGGVIFLIGLSILIAGFLNII
tara:strand:+ start:5475 stop:5711 length:237 start_codon:yes stop_codon:yes gene_type:complete